MNQVAEKTISWSATVYSNKLSSQCNLTAQIEQARDKMHDLTPNKIIVIVFTTWVIICLLFNSFIREYIENVNKYQA